MTEELTATEMETTTFEEATTTEADTYSRYALAWRTTEN